MNKFSASQLQVYQTCAWKYYLSYVLKISWPTPVTSFFKKQEAEMIAGNQFHRFVQRFTQGIEFSDGLQRVQDAKLRAWIDHFTRFNPLPVESKVFAEIAFTAVVGDAVWLGEFDCLAITNEKTYIFDWKTSEKPLNAAWLQKNAQTRLYPFLLARNLENLSHPKQGSFALLPEHIELVYWNPNYPEERVNFPYSEANYEKDSLYFSKIAKELSAGDGDAYPQTDDERICTRCKFQTRCNRGREMPVSPDQYEDMDAEYYTVDSDADENFSLELM